MYYFPMLTMWRSVLPTGVSSPWALWGEWFEFDIIPQKSQFFYWIWVRQVSKAYSFSISLRIVPTSNHSICMFSAICEAEKMSKFRSIVKDHAPLNRSLLSSRAIWQSDILSKFYHRPLRLLPSVENTWEARTSLKI